MAEFNPYQSWLQIPISVGETPTYYQLLGLSECEENPQTISKAAEKQLSRLLAINPEKHRPLWQKLINDLAEAQSTLTHPQHKANYDNRLRGGAVPATMPTATETVATKNFVAAVSPEAAPVSPQSAPVYTAAPYQAQPFQAPLTAAPPQTPPAQPSPYAPAQGYPVQGYPAYGQPVYGQPAYGQQPPPVAPPAQPYAPPVYGQTPAYGQVPYGTPMAPAFGQPMPTQPVYGQPAGATYGQPTYGAPAFNPAPAFDATPAANPYAPANLPNPMAPIGMISGHSSPSYSAPSFSQAYVGESTAVVNPMAPMNNARSPLPGTSQNYVEEDSSFGAAPLATPNPYRAPREESPVKYLVAGIAAVILIVGGLIASSKLGNKDDIPVAQKPTPPAIKNGKNTSEVVPVSTPADPKNTDPKSTELKQPEPVSPEPARPEPMPPEVTRPDPVRPEPVKPDPVMPEPTKPNPVMPEPMKPDPVMPEPMKPELTKPVTPEPIKPEPPKPEPTVATPEQQKEIFAKLAEVRVLLGERKFPEAKLALAKVKDLAMTPDMQELHLGMELVVDYAEQFWQAVQSSMRTLKGEIMVGSSLANVVNSEAGEITIRIAGANKNFKFTNLPPGLALAIATKWFDNKPANKAVLGAFYYVSKTGSIDEARKYWKEAGNGGVDVKFMLMLLDKPAIHGK